MARQTLDTLINSTHDYAFLLAPDGRILSAGPNISAFFGRTSEEMKGKTLFDFTPPDYPEENKERLHRLYSARDVYEYTTDFAGRRILVRGTPVFDASGNPTLVAVFGRDVTEEHRAQEFLRREQEKFRGIIENSTDGISLIDGSGRFLEWNQAMEALTGIPRDEVLQKYQWDVQMHFTPAAERTEEVRAEYKRVMEEYLSKGDAPWLNRLFPRWIEHRDGTRRRIEMVSFRVSSSFDMLTATITRDITEMALAEIELERKRQLLAEQNTELLERNDELDTFTHSVAHDLKNPLSLILGYAELAQYEGPDFSKEELQEYMASIIFNGKKMISIINSLLLLASARKEDVEVGAIDMKQIAGDAIRRLQKQIGDSGITITLPDDWFTPLGYAPWIEEVWVNYLSNAIRHAGPGCHVGVSAERVESGLLRYTVTDNGPGIPAGRLDELFLPFTRLSQAKIEGHGLGLSIVKRIIEKQGGRVGVISTVGEGSSFSFILPEAEAGR
jgi:PAS domain S-box-containing protein